MQLTPEEEAMLRGEHGETVREAIALQLEVAKFYDAERFVPVTNVHMMGDIEVMGDVGLDHLLRLARAGAHCEVATTTNARCFDFAHVDRLGQDRAEADKERRLIQSLREMNVVTADTCINYQTLYQPHFGEHVAWGDTGTVIWANSVCGARTNFESGPAAMAAAMTRRTPEYGYHVDEHRRGTFVVEVEADVSDFAEWGALAKLVGESHQSYFEVPVLTGIRRSPTADELKHLGASLASYGSMAMYHMVGVTPEAPSVDAALGGRPARETMHITQRDIDRVFAGYSDLGAPCNFVVFSGPQLSLLEVKRVSELFDGRRVHRGTTVFVTTSNGILSAARALGYAQKLEAAGVTILEGVCVYILQNLSRMREANGWTNMVSNSAKIVNTITAHKFNTILRRTEDCVEIACTGVFQ
ncbi:MAG TPA: aconitase X catalytic domain-containing protein [Burkholderiales bacterium]|nr:aconitase X catalytic domain-containing protein [Burkholderiales bacterium]